MLLTNIMKCGLFCFIGIHIFCTTKIKQCDLQWHIVIIYVLLAAVLYNWYLYTK